MKSVYQVISIENLCRIFYCGTSPNPENWESCKITQEKTQDFCQRVPDTLQMQIELHQIYQLSGKGFMKKGRFLGRFLGRPLIPVWNPKDNVIRDNNPHVKDTSSCNPHSKASGPGTALTRPLCFGWGGWSGGFFFGWDVCFRWGSPLLCSTSSTRSSSEVAFDCLCLQSFNTKKQETTPQPALQYIT